MPGSISASCAFTQYVVFESANPARHTHVSGSRWSCWPSASEGRRPKADTLLPTAQWSWAGFHWKDEKRGKVLLPTEADPVSHLDQEEVRSPALFSQLLVARRLAGSTSYNPKEEALPESASDSPLGHGFFPHGCISMSLSICGPCSVRWSWAEPYHPRVN